MRGLLSKRYHTVMAGGTHALSFMWRVAVDRRWYAIETGIITCCRGRVAGAALRGCQHMSWWLA